MLRCAGAQRADAMPRCFAAQEMRQAAEDALSCCLMSRLRRRERASLRHADDDTDADLRRFRYADAFAFFRYAVRVRRRTTLPLDAADAAIFFQLRGCT